MLTADTLKMLDGHQRGILAWMEQASRTLDRDPAEARAELTSARWELVRLINTYRLFKEGEIFSLAATGAHPQTAAIRQLEADSDAAAEAFRTHVMRWSAIDKVANWPEYRSAMLALRHRMSAGLRKDRAAVVAMLAAPTQARRPDPAASDDGRSLDRNADA